jgi:carbamoyl-phosphate synthase large subunit
MILGAGIMQKPIIEKAKALGHFVITIDRDTNAVGNQYSDCPIEMDTNDINGILEAAIKHQIDGILTTSDYPVRAVAVVCEKLNLFGPKTTAAEICTNKFLMREHLKKNKFNYPKYKLLRSQDDINKIDFFPAVIKPLDSSGSRGVRKVSSTEDFRNSFSYTQSQSRSGDVLIEEFIEGNEYSVETLSQKGKTHIISITEKTVKGKEGLFFVEDRHIIPANLNEGTTDLIKETVLRLIDTLDLGDSATHTEIKVNKKGIYIIEIGARLGGDFITSDLVPLATGIDMLANQILLALGEPVKVLQKQNKHAGIQFINSLNYERASSFINNNKSKLSRFNIDPFVDIELENSFNRLGYFISVTESRNDLQKLLDLEN